MEEICYGGNLKVNDDITAYSVTIYLSIGDEKEVLMSGTTEAVTGETIDTPDDLGKIYGDIIENDRIDKLSGTLNDNLWMEVETTDLDGEIETYQLQLNVTEITENIAR